jgi:hypothetical protein
MLALHALPPLALLAFGGWLVSMARNDVSIADSLWPLLILLATHPRGDRADCGLGAALGSPHHLA